MYWCRSLPGPPARAGALVVLIGLHKFLASVHYKWAVMGNGLSNGATLEQEQFGGFGTVFDYDLLIGFEFQLL